MTTETGPAGRAHHLRHAVRLEILTLGWNIVEGVIAVAAVLVAGSVALLAFGIDSFVESASAGIMLWRLVAERRATSNQIIETLETRARKLIAVSLFALAAWVLFDACSSLVRQEKPEASVVGIVLTATSMAVMLWLARAKRRVAAALKSRAMEADAFQTTACWWLSLSALVGVGLNTVLGWWWADPVSALVIVFFLVSEGREAWKGEDSCGDRH
jgi:divalent metal cation (Fe/Co/Zn/Cd) transporter